MHSSRGRGACLHWQEEIDVRSRRGRREARRLPSTGPLSLAYDHEKKLIANRTRAKSQRSLSRRTNLSPDQVASTAHTFTSTSPSSRPIARITFSVRSVGAQALCFGHEIQSMPLEASLVRRPGKRLARSAFLVTKSIPNSSAPRAPDVTPAGKLPSVSEKSAGGFTICMRAPALIPSLATSGVPEYPAGLFTEPICAPASSGKVFRPSEARRS